MPKTALQLVMAATLEIGTGSDVIVLGYTTIESKKTVSCFTAEHPRKKYSVPLRSESVIE